MNLLIDLFKKALKGDSYRASESPVKYVDLIPLLNNPKPTKSGAPNTAIKTQKTKSSPNQSTSKGSKLPGS